MYTVVKLINIKRFLMLFSAWRFKDIWIQGTRTGTNITSICPLLVSTTWSQNSNSPLTWFFQPCVLHGFGWCYGNVLKEIFMSLVSIYFYSLRLNVLVEWLHTCFVIWRFWVQIWAWGSAILTEVFWWFFSAPPENFWIVP